MGRRFLSRAGLLLAIAAAGCYRPSVDACLYRCNGIACPNDLVCNNDKWCTAEMTDSCTDMTGDGGGDDGPMPDASCGWSVPNFDACSAQLHTLDTASDWTLPAGTTIVVNTMTASTTGSGTAMFPTTGFKAIRGQLGAGAAPALILGVHDLLLEGTIDVNGDIPLIIIASGTVTISGTIRFNAAVMTVAGCSGGAGSGGSGSITGAGGGAGGTLGSPGAAGGIGGSASGGMGEAGGTSVPVMPVSLTPMRGGCAGGRGGSWTNPNVAGGGGGKAGGGIQISARTRLQFNAGGMIAANGDGGNSTSGVGSHGGGGGGGSGGAILLDAPLIVVESAKICANGGGGGGSQSGTPGSVSTVCAVNPAPGGGTGPSSGGYGAANGINADAGDMGLSGAGTAEGGGGGGGGHGRIRTLGTVTGTPMIMSPMATN